MERRRLFSRKYKHRYYRDLPFVEAFDLTASVRHTDVNTYGSGDTYKLSANWTIGGGFRARASRGTSFRAPALFELYLLKVKLVS